MEAVRVADVQDPDNIRALLLAFRCQAVFMQCFGRQGFPGPFCLRLQIPGYARCSVWHNTLHKHVFRLPAAASRPCKQWMTLLAQPFIA